MFHNYLKSAFRNLKKNWKFTFISVLGLSIGSNWRKHLACASRNIELTEK